MRLTVSDLIVIMCNVSNKSFSNSQPPCGVPDVPLLSLSTHARCNVKFIWLAEFFDFIQVNS